MMRFVRYDDVGGCGRGCVVVVADDDNADGY